MTLDNMGGTFLPAMITRPEFAGYLAERIFNESRFVQSGVVARNSALDVRAGGTRLRVPEFDPIAPTIERIDSSNSWGTSGAGYLTPQALSTDEQVMTILRRGFAYSVDDISKLGSGVADPLGHVRNQLAAAVNKAKTATLMAQLGGIFGNISASGVLGANTINKTGTTTASASNYLTAGNVVAAKQLLGERGSELSTIIMHSAVAAYLEELGYLQVQSSGGSVYAGGGVGSGLGAGLVGRFAGLNVIVDDQVGVIAGGTATHLNKYQVYLCGSGVIGEGIRPQQAQLPRHPHRGLPHGLSHLRHPLGSQRRQPNRCQLQRQLGRHRLLRPLLYKRKERTARPSISEHPIRHWRLLRLDPSSHQPKPPVKRGFFHTLAPRSCRSNTATVSAVIL